jgi:hypothetical protein
MDQNTTTAPASSLIQTNRITKDVARSRLPQSLDWRLQLFSLRTTKVNLLPWAARQLDIGRETRGQVRDLAAIIREKKKSPYWTGICAMWMPLSRRSRRCFADLDRTNQIPRVNIVRGTKDAT